MVQYSGGLTYSELLTLTQPINEAYAKCWGYDYDRFIGLMIQAELSTNETTTHVPESRATYNKVMILERVLTDPFYQKYDMLLILDSDALMYDFSRDITTILPDNRLVAAHKVSNEDGEENTTWNINIGVTVWNLRHPAALPCVVAGKGPAFVGSATNRHFETVIKNRYKTSYEHYPRRIVDRLFWPCQQNWGIGMDFGYDILFAPTREIGLISYLRWNIV